ncbi:MAG: coniferyl aldehyde dehydrogenase [Pseudomonadota bacterium]|nr:coniferyl aldehyde dehydrogenase [Pseudomonadota bacterium]
MQSQKTSGVVVAAFPDAVNDALPALLASQRAAFAARGEPSPLSARKADLKALLDVLMQRRLELAEAMQLDFGGRAPQESLLELFVVIDDLRHALAHLKGWIRTRRVAANWQFRPSRARLMPQPLGVIGVIGAYNYPVMTTLSPVVGALAAGNHVMMKPSSLTPRTSELMREIVSGIFRENHVAVVTGNSSIAKRFSKLAFDHLVFTGSTRVGKLVMRDASENLVPVTLELGGKSPAIVGDDFDMKSAAETIVQSKLMNAGQTCVASDYALVPEARVSEFLEHAGAAIRRYYPSLVSNPDYGRVLMRSDWERLDSWVSEAREKGALVETFNPANEHCDADNRVFPPTLVSGCPLETKLGTEEIFGPVLPVISYRTLDDAIAQVNAGDRPLALYYFGHRSVDVDKVLRRTICGGVSINGCGYHAIQHHLPFGGVGASGIGAYHGQGGFERFSHIKPVLYMSPLTKAGVLLRPPFGGLAAWVLGFMLHNRPRKESL